MTTAPTPQPEALRLAAWLKEGAWSQMRLGDVEAAGRELKRLHAENERLESERITRINQQTKLSLRIVDLQAENERLRAEQSQAMSEASSLAMRLFREHYSSEPPYASGAVEFGLFSDLRGVISQISNMSAGLTRAALEARKPLPPTEAEANALWAACLRKHKRPGPFELIQEFCAAGALPGTNR